MHFTRVLSEQLELVKKRHRINSIRQLQFKYIKLVAKMK